MPSGRGPQEDPEEILVPGVREIQGEDELMFGDEDYYQDEEHESHGCCDMCWHNEENRCHNPKWKLGRWGMRIMRKHKHCKYWKEAPDPGEDDSFMDLDDDEEVI